MFIQATDDKTIEIIKWLKGLIEEISEPVVHEMRANLSGNEYQVSVRERIRSLSTEEWARFQEVAPLFTIEPSSAQYGFNFGLTLWHKLNNIEPLSRIFFICGEYLPDTMDQRFNGAWKALSPFSHNPENRRRLLHYGKEDPKPKSYYEY